MVTSIELHTSKMVDVNKSFVGSQNDLKNKANKCAADLKKEMTDTLEAYTKSTHTKAAQVSKALKAKSKELDQ